MNIKSSLIAELKDKEYRDAYVAAQITIGLPFQARALRVNKGWTQEQLAERAGMSQPRIAEIEKPRKRRFNLETLLRIASAHDVGLEVRFVPFGQIIAHDESFDPDSFEVPTFAEELAAAEKEEQADIERKALVRSAEAQLSRIYINTGASPRGWSVVVGTGGRQINLEFMRASLYLAVNNQKPKQAPPAFQAAGIQQQWPQVMATR